MIDYSSFSFAVMRFSPFPLAIRYTYPHSSQHSFGRFALNDDTLSPWLFPLMSLDLGIEYVLQRI